MYKVVLYYRHYTRLNLAFANHYFEAFRAIKLIPRLVANLNLEGLIFYAFCMVYAGRLLADKILKIFETFVMAVQYGILVLGIIG